MSPQRRPVRILVLTATLSLTVTSQIVAQSPAALEPAAAEMDAGIPVESPVVRRACGGCHQVDEQGRMTRISYQRTTPEGWQQTIRRMVLLNGLEIEPVDAREAVRYLANAHGLAPAEARPAAFEVERRMIDHVYEADPETQETCTKCHSMGRVMTQRRTREEWRLLTAMHQGFYPLTDFQSFYGRGPAPPAGPDGDARYPVEKAIEHLATAFPLGTSEWTAWSANMRTPRLAGRWSLVGWQRGKGAVYGTVTVTDGDAPDAFRTDATYVYARTGDAVTRSGEAIVYTGFQWRGRSTDTDDGPLREVMFVERDWQQMSGRWFTGDHDEIGLDVTVKRNDGRTMVTGVHPPAVRQSAGEIELSIYGADLPADLDVAAVDFGSGVEVTDIVVATPTVVTLRARVAADAIVGTRDLFLGPAFLQDAVAVYDRIDRIAVTPDTGMARVGGVAFPRQYEQFEARGYHNGPDGRPDTEDDLDLGLVDVDWTLEEYAVTVGDDDIRFVGTLAEDGFFTPADDGPNPDRRNNANNIGDVWVVATLHEDDENEAASRRLRARAHLLVTVPLYIRRDPPPTGP